ncbi:AAA family ATPase [Streptomyces sp. MUM 203J]|uniref:AfsR/SARP family transcriptional regulator n=1 Tax=Streptomyces sp. MUM 203J TaxID=2791990 RepID=UPI001F03C543|nr:AfsR/SARP family transcriptional regulator [Streptomyces sp. MUM 203J]MCH0543458.1 AAA family ATPase [Streptomyces sp. MUM 203J]
MPRPFAQPAGQPVALRFSVLGPLTVHRGPRPLDLGPFKQRVVLATLLGSPGSPVSVDALTDAVWPEEPPRTARKNLQVYVSTLRGLLAEDGDREDRPRLTHTCGGYLLRVAEEELDVLRFRALVRAAEGQRPRPAARLLREALDLWQGPPLGDLRQSPRLAEEAERLELRHLTAYESWAEAELELGRAPAVVEGLQDLAERHPLRERLRAAWMYALSRSGRQAEALAVYEDYRQLLARELGLEPGAAMAARHRAVLAGAGHGEGDGAAGPRDGRGGADDGDAGAATALPPDVGDFAGRGEELREVLDLLDGEPAASGPVPVLLTGPAGAGKTALAVRAAHLLGDRFEDGRLYVTLRDPDGRPRSLGEVLTELGDLAGLRRPPGPEAWREWAAGHRVLVVLDDVPDERAVRPLLPCRGQSRMLLTAHGQLGGLAPVHRVALPPLSGAEALELLGGLVGHGRVRADRDAALRIVRACGHAPLAVRVSGMRLAVLRHLPLREFADRLAEPAGALEELTAGDVSVRRRLARAWDALPAEYGRDAARLAAGTESGPFGVPRAAGILGCDERRAVRVVEELIDAGVVTSPSGEVTAHAARYELPPLVRLYARYGTSALTPG